MASILEVSPGGKKYFNVFDAAPENEVSIQSCPEIQIMTICREMGQTSNNQQR